DFRAATGVMREVLVRSVNETDEQQLRAVSCPVELVWGEADLEAPPAVAEAALGLLAHGRLTLRPGVGHFVPTEDAQALGAARAGGAALGGALAVGAGPVGLSLRGRRPGPLVWTRRLRLVTTAWAVRHLAVVGVGVGLGEGPLVAAAACVLTPLLIDAALA